jgi:hypothetical protein
MTREDLAAFMVDQLESDEWLGRSVVVGYRDRRRLRARIILSVAGST